MRSQPRREGRGDIRRPGRTRAHAAGDAQGRRRARSRGRAKNGGAGTRLEARRRSRPTSVRIKVQLGSQCVQYNDPQECVNKVHRRHSQRPVRASQGPASSERCAARICAVCGLESHRPARSRSYPSVPLCFPRLRPLLVLSCGVSAPDKDGRVRSFERRTSGGAVAACVTGRGGCNRTAPSGRAGNSGTEAQWPIVCACLPLVVLCSHS